MLLPSVEQAFMCMHIYVSSCFASCCDCCCMAHMACTNQQVGIRLWLPSTTSSHKAHSPSKLLCHHASSSRFEDFAGTFFACNCLSAIANLSNAMSLLSPCWVRHKNLQTYTLLYRHNSCKHILHLAGQMLCCFLSEDATLVMALALLQSVTKWRAAACGKVFSLPPS